VTGADGFTLIDTHTHFYDPTRAQGVPWPPRDDKLLYRSVLPKDYRALPVPRPVTGTVVVEASPWLEDNQWVLDLAAQEPFIVGLVGNLPVGTKQFAGHLKRFAANKLFRGIRLRDRKLEGTLDDLTFVSDLKLLADQDLSLDVVGGREILPYADRLAKEVPDLRIIIDHLAGVVVDGKAPPPDWVKQMRALARSPNVYCKLSGLVEGTGRSNGSAPSDVEFYRPVLDAMRMIFGPERLMYASNWPVSERFAPLATVQGIVGEYFRSDGHRAEEQVFSQTSTAAYRWVQRKKAKR
jgi:predicted TIM-barrel fold metal-dependent hydrolase